MPAFAPLATTNEKPIYESSLFLNNFETPSEGFVDEKKSLRKPFVAIFINKSIAQIVKLIVLCVLSLVHLMYLNDFIATFAAFEEMTNEVKRIEPKNEEEQNDVTSVLYTMHAFIDYKKNLWMSVGAMCASLATTASIIVLVDKKSSVSHHAANALIRIVDLVTFVFICVILFLRLTSALTITHMTQHALRSASRLSNPSVNTLINQLICSVENRDELPLCSKMIVNSIFPVKLIEYLVILCILTGAYILLAYLIEWCIRHFFPPTHSKLSPIDATSRRIHTNRSMVEQRGVLVAP